MHQENKKLHLYKNNTIDNACAEHWDLYQILVQKKGAAYKAILEYVGEGQGYHAMYGQPLMGYQSPKSLKILAITMSSLN
jgi:hypothetical protein